MVLDFPFQNKDKHTPLGSPSWERLHVSEAPLPCQVFKARGLACLLQQFLAEDMGILQLGNLIAYHSHEAHSQGRKRKLKGKKKNKKKEKPHEL